MSELNFCNARLVLADEVIEGGLRAEDGRIAAIDRARGAGGIDCEGDYLIPGLIELHTDNLERHIRPRPKVDWPHAAAILAHDGELASAGVTTVFDAVRIGSVTSRNSAYGRYARDLATELLAIRARGVLRISHFLHLRAEICSETLIEELAEFGPEDRVGILSLMDHTPGQRQWTDIPTYRNYLQGKYSMTEAEFIEHMALRMELKANLGAAHEAAAVEAARRLGAVLASHDDTTAGHVAASAAHGVRVAEFPTTEEAAQACRDAGIAVMMGAPNLVRGGSHSGNVAAGALARGGLLDIVSSDYVPSALLTAAFLLADLWGDVARGVATVTSAPAAAAGLADRGRLAEGLRADLVRVTLMEGTPVVRGVWSHGRQVG